MGLSEIIKLERPLLILMLGVLLSHLGTYMVIPILPIMLRLEAGLSLIQIGTVLAAIAIAFQFGSLLGGFLADRIGRRFIIGLGALVGAGGLIGFGLFTTYLLLLLMAITIGLGNGLNAPSTKAAIAALASEENQTTAFSLRGIAANIGTATAGLIVFFLITGTSHIIFWLAGIIYILLTIKSWLFLPKNCGDDPCPVIPAGAYREVFKHKPFLVFGTVSILIWALYAQLALALPLRAADILPDPKNVALIWTINSAIVIFLQGSVTNWIIQRLHPLTALGFGMVFIGFGVGSLYWSSAFIHLVISGAIFVMGEMLILPTIDSTVSQLSRAELIGLFFGLANVVAGLGEAGGNFVGGRLLEVGTTISYLPWVVYGTTGIFICLIVFMLKRWQPIHKALQKAAEKEDGPKHAPKVSPGPTQHRSHPFDRWEPEILFRKRRDT
ncbi:MFS transporter [Sutcliffiella cohnii]